MILNVKVPYTYINTCKFERHTHPIHKVLLKFYDTSRFKYWLTHLANFSGPLMITKSKSNKRKTLNIITFNTLYHKTTLYANVYTGNLYQQNRIGNSQEIIKLCIVIVGYILH